MSKVHEEPIRLQCLEMTQPIGKMYIGIMDHLDLQTIAYADIRRLATGTEKREVEIYTGIERPLSSSRVKEIQKYVEMVDACFPTSVILHIEPKNVRYDPESKTMELPRKDDIAKVLDGQHRIAGLEKCVRAGNRFQINVTIFVGMELEDQAIVFATINKTQTRVNQSLVADLFEFATHRSPQKSAHNIVRALNEKEGSPFKDKIKILGTAEDKEKETITQATFVESLLKYTSKDPGYDRNVYKRGKKPERYDGNELRNRFFRNLFIDEKDTEIAKIIWNYFAAVQDRWPRAWNEVVPELILNRSTGFIAFMRFLKAPYLELCGRDIGKVPTKADFAQIIGRIDLEARDFNSTRYLPGTTGQSQLYRDLLEKTGLTGNE